MKKIFGIALALMIGVSTTGCVSTNEQDTEEYKKEKVEQKVEEVEEVESDTPEKKSTGIITIEDEDFKTAMTTVLSDAKYEEYFESIRGRVIEFDGSVDFIQLLEGKKTRVELLLTYGDYSETKVVGPFIKVKDVGYGGGISRKITSAKTNVKVRAMVYGYDTDSSLLMINPISIEPR